MRSLQQQKFPVVMHPRGLGTRLESLSRIVPVLLVLVLPVIAWAAFSALSQGTTDILEWLPTGSEEVSGLNWYDSHFGTDQVLVVSWQGATLGDPRIEAVTAGIKTLKTPSGDPFFSHITSGSEIFDYLTESLRVNSDTAIDRLDGWLSGPDEATAIAAVIGRAGAEDAALVVNSVRREAAGITSLPPEEIRIAGTTADGVAVKAASRQWVIELALIAILVAVGIAMLALGGLRQALPVLISALTSALSSLALMYLLNLQVDGLSVMAPVLGFVLTASVTLHMDGYRRKFGQGAKALTRALLVGRWPTSVALTTTFLGFAALLVSETLPIQRFAVASCATIVVVWLVCWLIWPALVLALRVPGKPVSKGSPDQTWPSRIIAGRKVTFTVTVLLTLVAIGGLPGLDASFGIDRLLRADNRLIVDYRWFEDNIGDVVPVEIVVRMSGKNDKPDSHFLPRVRLIGEAREEVRRLPNVTGVFAADTLMPTDEELHADADETVLEQRSDGFERRSQAFRLLSHDENGDELWRISARVTAFGGLDFDNLDETLGETVRESLAHYPDLVDVRVLGGLPMVARAQHQLLRDLLMSFGIAVGVLSIGFALMVRNLRTGMLIVIPNVLPVTLVFGFLGWAGSPIDIGLVMTASAALGLAVDDSAHLLASFSRAQRRGQTAPLAAQTALKQIAPAALRTSLLCGIPIAVFAASPFLPAARFGSVMALLIGVALIVDLIVLPSLLTKFGKGNAPIVGRSDSGYTSVTK